MGCIHTSNSNKSRICVMELKYSIDIFNQSVISAFEGWRRSVICRVRGDPSFSVIEVERVKDNYLDISSYTVICS